MEDGWHRFPDETPPKRGAYCVIRRWRAGKTVRDEYVWNGGYWITHANSPSSAVIAWRENETPETAAQDG